jgi:hypothetical protein
MQNLKILAFRSLGPPAREECGSPEITCGHTSGACVNAANRAAQNRPLENYANSAMPIKEPTFSTPSVIFDRIAMVGHFRSTPESDQIAAPRSMTLGAQEPP